MPNQSEDHGSTLQPASRASPSIMSSQAVENALRSINRGLLDFFILIRQQLHGVVDLNDNDDLTRFARDVAIRPECAILGSDLSFTFHRTGRLLELIAAARASTVPSEMVYLSHAMRNRLSIDLGIREKRLRDDHVREVFYRTRDDVCIKGRYGPSHDSKPERVWQASMRDRRYEARNDARFNSGVDVRYDTQTNDTRREICSMRESEQVRDKRYFDSIHYSPSRHEPPFA